MDIAIIMFAVFGMRSDRSEFMDNYEKRLSVNQYQFSFYYSKAAMVWQVFFWIVFISLLVSINLIELNIFSLISAPLIIWHFLLTLQRLCWRLKIDGHSGYIRTLLGKSIIFPRNLLQYLI